MTRKVYTPEKARMLPALLAFLLVMLVTAGSAYSQMYLASGTTVKVETGTTVTNTGNLDMAGTSTLTNNGTMYVKGNLTNNNATDNSLGTGTIEFNGTAAQTISGPNVFGTLVINNSNGVSLTGSSDNTVNTALTLTSGRLTLGSRNLLLGASVASVGGTLNASNMVVASGTGELRKQFTTGTSDPAAFVFPIGDNTSTAEYSPATLDFGSSTFAGGNYAGVKVTDAAPGSPFAAPQVTRYWDVASSGITSFTAQASFVYVDADLDLGAGTESDIYCTKISLPYVTYNQTVVGTNTLVAPGLTSFSRFSGTAGGHTVNLFAFLEGANDGTATMTTILPAFTSGYPSSSPFPLTQPYSAAPWSYAGTETANPTPANVVDWVYLELRSADQPANATAATIFGKKAGFLLSNGAIVGEDGTSDLRFTGGVPGGANVYLVVKHRNHLAIMSANNVTKNSSGIFTYDFTDAGTKTYGYPYSIKYVGSKWSMVAGNGFFDADINTDDVDYSWVGEFGAYDGYYSGDFNMTGAVDTDDMDFLWFPNFGLYGLFNDNPSGKYHSYVP